MRTIQKFTIPFPYKPSFELLMPIGADVLTTQTVDRHAFIWAVVDESAKQVSRRFAIVRTAAPMSEEAGRYVGTFHVAMSDGALHLFEAIDGN